MIRELVICIIIVLAIFVLEFITQNYTEKIVKEVTGMFDKIEENILKQNMGQMYENVMIIGDKWEEKQKKLAYYIEHDELEKVHTAIVIMKSYIETKDFPSAMAALDEGKFVLEHIKEKNSFNLQNIF